jgi:alkylation response protein AidB-like acyl-CoA dehydrogenase
MIGTVRAATWQRLSPPSAVRPPELDAVEEFLDDRATREALRAHESTGSYPGAVVEEVWRRAGPALFDPYTVNCPHIAALNELLARHSGSLAITIGVNGLALLPVYLAGSPAQCDLVRAGLFAGKRAALLLTELPNGSNLARTATTATADGEGYRLAGEKHLINGGTEHDLLVTFARLRDGLALFLVERDNTVVALPRWRTLPVPSADIAGVRFDGTRIGGDRMLGGPEDGFEIVQRTLALSRGGIGALAAGTASAAFADALGYARTRDIYGDGPIVGLGAIAEHLMRMAALDLMVTAMAVKATALSNSLGPAAGHFTAVAKFACCALAERAVTEGRRVLGSQALLEDSGYPGRVRDVMLYGVFDGTAHVVLDQVQWVLGRFASRVDGAAEPVGVVAAAYAAAPQPIMVTGRRRARLYAPSIIARCAGLAAASGSSRVHDLNRLATALCSVVRDGRPTGQAARFAGAAVLAETEALLAACELADPACRGILGLPGTVAPIDEAALDYALGWRGAALAGRVEELADDLGVPVPELRGPWSSRRSAGQQKLGPLLAGGVG